MELRHLKLPDVGPFSSVAEEEGHYSSHYPAYLVMEHLARHDCFYDGLLDYEYLFLLDPDEIFVPAPAEKAPSLVDFAAKLQQETKFDTLGWQSAYFVPNKFHNFSRT